MLGYVDEIYMNLEISLNAWYMYIGAIMYLNPLSQCSCGPLCVFDNNLFLFRHWGGFHWCMPEWTFLGGLWKKWKLAPYLRPTKKNPPYQGTCVCVCVLYSVATFVALLDGFCHLFLFICMYFCIYLGFCRLWCKNHPLRMRKPTTILSQRKANHLQVTFFRMSRNSVLKK